MASHPSVRIDERPAHHRPAHSREEQAADRIDPSGSLDREKLLRQLTWLGTVLDDAYRIPGTRIRFGWDSLIGLVPVVGDGVTTLLSMYFLWSAQRLGVSNWTLTRMLGNVGIDFVVGTIPLVGDLFDVTWRANRKNLKLLRKALEKQGHLPSTPKRKGPPVVAQGQITLPTARPKLPHGN